VAIAIGGLVDSAASSPAVQQPLWAIGERRFPFLRYAFQNRLQVLATEVW